MKIISKSVILYQQYLHARREGVNIVEQLRLLRASNWCLREYGR